MRTKLGIGDQQLLLALALVYDLIRKELLQALSELAFLDGSNFLHSGSSRSEAVEGLKLQATRCGRR